MREVKIFASLDHPRNLVRYHSAWVEEVALQFNARASALYCTIARVVVCFSSQQPVSRNLEAKINTIRRTVGQGRHLFEGSSSVGRFSEVEESEFEDSESQPEWFARFSINRRR